MNQSKRLAILLAFSFCLPSFISDKDLVRYPVKNWSEAATQTFSEDFNNTKYGITKKAKHNKKKRNTSIRNNKYDYSLRSLEDIYGSYPNKSSYFIIDDYDGPLIVRSVIIKRNKPVILTKYINNSYYGIFYKSPIKSIMVFVGRYPIFDYCEDDLQKPIDNEIIDDTNIDNEPINSELSSLNKKLDDLLIESKKSLEGEYSPNSLENLDKAIKEVETDRDNTSLDNLSKNINKLQANLNQLDKVVVFEDESVKKFLLDYFKAYDGNDVYESDMNEYGFRLSDKSFRKDPNSNDIYEREMKLLTDLRLIIYDENYEWQDIQSIKGIESAANLENLTISSNADNSSNAVSDISSLSGLTKLKNLRLAHNAIEDMSPLKGLSNLERLYISHNQIKDISTIKQLPNLKVLDISVNKIDDISDVEDLKDLEEFHAIRNQIVDISPLRDLVKLKRLAIAENKIEDVNPLSNLTDLTYLNLGQNNIQSFESLEELNNLENLDIRNNDGKDFDTSNLIKLTDLNIDDNPNLKVSGIENLLELNSLHLRNTGLDNIDFIKPLTKVVYLDISNNQIQDISDLKDLNDISSLNISNNNIKDISSLEDKELGKLSFANNNIAGLTSLNKIKGLYSTDGNNQVISAYEVKLNSTEVEVESPYKGLGNLAVDGSVNVDAGVEGLTSEYNPENDKLIFKTNEDFINDKREINTNLTYSFINGMDYDNPNYTYEVENFKIIVE